MLEKTGGGFYISPMQDKPSIHEKAVGASNVTFDATVDKLPTDIVLTGFPNSRPRQSFNR